MLKIVGIMLCGVLVGYLLRNKKMGLVAKLIIVAIWLLLFLLGIAVGANDEIMNNLHTIGWQALVLSLGGVLGSVVLAWVVYKFWFQHSGESEKS